ncbi:MAG TPA: AmmeMemoRadiSam system protein B [Candidatus Binatia bacterium]|nr:AmmeMemoRadiSam system protein B [Candidatus Binatia bacterium]
MEKMRPASVAGSFYPSEPDELRRLIEECFVSSPLGPQGDALPCPSLLGGMVPHAGYIYSGPCAAHLYARLDQSVQRVIVLGINHRGRGHRAALSPAESWETPLGRIKVDTEVNGLLEAQVNFLRFDEAAHFQEHSIEVQLPFLQRVLGEFAISPISLADLTLEECAQLGQAIADIYARRPHSTVILASSDLSHYLTAEETNQLDRVALEKVLAMNAAELLQIVAEEGITMCGALPTAVFLFAANALGAKQARLLKHYHSGDAVPMREVVGYASVMVEP